jgi:chaperonin GroEL
VLTEALVLGGLDSIKEGHNRTEVLRALSDITTKVVDKLVKKSKKVSNAMLSDVATISANNDKEIGKIISEVYKEVGKNGIVTVERSQTADTYAETTKGLKIERGYSSQLFINNQKKDECIFEDVMVMVADVDISNILQIEHELMQDIAISVGATYFSEKTGDDLSHISFADLGHASRVIVGRDSTVLVKSTAKADETLIAERVAQLWDAHAMAKRKTDKDFILERIASLTGGVGVIYVGGNTDLEQKELFDRVDDAVCAVRSA